MHIFLTGPKGVGKSTLLNAILDAFPGKAGGFRTVRLDTFLPGEFTVHLLALDREQIPRPENLLFFCADPNRETRNRFDKLGCDALEQAFGADLLVMDELGPHETASVRFQRAVRAALDGDIPILGVLQQADDWFLKEIANHPKVQVMPVALENREDLLSRIGQFVNLLNGKEE